MKPSTKRVLTALQAAADQGCTTNQLCQPDMGGVRFGARIAELRDAGYRISEQRIRPNQSRYVLERQDDEGPIVLSFCTGMYECCREAT